MKINIWKSVFVFIYAIFIIRSLFFQNVNSEDGGYEGDMEDDGNLMPPPQPPG